MARPAAIAAQRPAPPVALPSDVAAVEPPPEAKAAHCDRCDRRFVPVASPICDECLASDARRRRQQPASFTRCNVLGNVVAMGRREDGRVATRFAVGDVAEFSDADVLSLPEFLAPVA